MIASRIAIPPTPNRDTRRAPPLASLETADSRVTAPTLSTRVQRAEDATEQRNRDVSNEERHILVVVVLMFVLLVMPAAIMLIYLLTNPDAFQDHVPQLYK